MSVKIDQKKGKDTNIGKGNIALEETKTRTAEYYRQLQIIMTTQIKWTHFQKIILQKLTYERTRKLMRSYNH